MFSSILDVRYVWGADWGQSHIVLTRSGIFVHPERGMYKLIPIADQNDPFSYASNVTPYEFRTMPWGETTSILYTEKHIMISFQDDHKGLPREVCMTKIKWEINVIRLQRWTKRMIPKISTASGSVSAEDGASAPVDFIDLRDEPEVADSPDRPRQSRVKRQRAERTVKIDLTHLADED